MHAIRTPHINKPLAALCLWLLSATCWPVAVPDDPSQSIRYWKPQVIAPNTDPAVEAAHSLFKQLLGAWDISRVEPSLNVIRGSDGPWAASLADGNILLSRAAIDTCMTFGQQRGEHLLAFILAHELAHQKGNDLWHQQFFRLIGNQSAERTQAIKHDLAINPNDIAKLESLEAQADLDAVVMMASVGYDPYQIVKDKDFYTSWIENIWQTPCSSTIPACKTAQERALRTQAQLESISDQTVFYELGIQALVAKRYEQARAYLTAYARNFPGRSVHNSIGVSFLAEAIALWPQYAAEVGKPNVYFPLFVEATPAWRQTDGINKRGSAAQIKANISTLAEQALNYFDKAQRLSPKHKNTHYLRVLSYLLMENSPMATGILDGQYVPLFGKDTQSELLRALSFAIAGKTQTAQKALAQELTQRSKHSASNPASLLFAMAQNQAQLAAFHGNETDAQNVWKQFAKMMSQQGEGYLLQLALGKLRPNPQNHRAPQTPALHYREISLNGPADNRRADTKELWFDGEPLTIHRDAGGMWLSDKADNTIALWLNAANFTGLDRLQLGASAERVIRVIGPADRQISLNTGEFLAYDRYGLALRISQDKIASWFLYQPQPDKGS